MNLLEINDLVVRYRTGTVLEHIQGKSPTHVTVLAGVSLAIEPGETLGLIGESGSGKTTLGRALLGLAPISAGTITLADVPVTRSKSQLWRDVRRNVGLMFQDPMAALDPRMTLGASVTEPLAIHKKSGLDRRARAIELLEQVGLGGDFVDRYPHQISGGQARRVTVARALALRPKLVVRRRAHGGARPFSAGRPAQSAQRSAGQARAELPAHHPQPGGGAARHRPYRHHVPGPDHRDRPHRRYLRPAGAPYTRALLVSRGSTERAKPLAGEVPELSGAVRSGCEFHTRCPIARDICRAEMPAERLLGNGQAVRCHFPMSRRQRPPGPHPPHLPSCILWRPRHEVA